MSTTGGRPRAITDATYGVGGAWSPDGVIVFSGAFGDSLKGVAASGGPAEHVTTLDAARAESVHAWPVLLPDGKRFPFLFRTNAGESNRIEMASLAGGGRTVVLEADVLAGYSAPWLLFVRAGTLWQCAGGRDR